MLMMKSTNILKYFFAAVFLILSSSCKQTVQTQQQQQSPRQLYPGLFEAVQSSNLFPDSKVFPDAVGKTSATEILKQYHQQKNQPNFNLKTFVLQNFSLPVEVASAYHSVVGEPVETHINKLWQILQRQADQEKPNSSLIPLPHSYIVPGGRFREVYYWDSYFTMLGLQESGKYNLIENIVNNFAYLINHVGFIPNGNRSYYLTRSQPPFFSLMVKLLAEVKGAEKADSVLIANADALQKEYNFWMETGGAKTGAVKHVVFLPDGEVLNRYWDAGDFPREEAYKEDIETAAKSKQNAQVVYRDIRSAAESGWDFSSRWFKVDTSLATIQTTNIIPVDLNALLYHLEQTLAEAYHLKKDDKRSIEYQNLASKRKNTLLKYCWNAKTKWFFDYNWKEQSQSKVYALSGIFPMYFGMVYPADGVAASATLKQKFLQPGGLVTTTNKTGQQWDAPNGWAPLQWIAISALHQYNQNALANEVAKRWQRINLKVYQQTGKLMEKYNVADTGLIAGGGEYATQDGFGWTNGVLLKLLHHKTN
jgi:alpha,alpha-trehalase